MKPTTNKERPTPRMAVPGAGCNGLCIPSIAHNPTEYKSLLKRNQRRFAIPVRPYGMPRTMREICAQMLRVCRRNRGDARFDVILSSLEELLCQRPTTLQ